MISVSNNQKQLLVLSIGIFVVLFALLKTAPTTKATDKNLSGYIQLVENVTLPILLADQTQQFNLQIGALIHNTPITQVRIYDTAETLLFRVQNTAEASPNAEPNTLRRSLAFEDSALGILEVDVDPDIATNQTPNTLWTLTIATLLAAAIASIVLLRPAIREKVGLANSESGDGSTIGSIAEDIKKTAPISNQQILLVVRTERATKFSDSESELSQLSELSATIGEMANIYGAEPITVAANTLIYSMKGTANKQGVHQAVMLSWGLAQPSPRDSAAADRPNIQSYLIQADDFTSPVENTLSFWTELDTMCDTGKTSGAFVTHSLAENVDQNSFELSPSKNEFMRIADAIPSIKKLWQNQKANIAPK